MNAFINYLLEANLGLCFFLVTYWTFLRKDTDFTLVRLFLLVSIAASLIFPLFHFVPENHIVPSISGLIPTSWLPEVIVLSDGSQQTRETYINFDVWFLTQLIYATGASIMLLIFFVRLLKLLRLIHTAPSYSVEKFVILESPQEEASFSFFNFIFIGNASELSELERSLIIDHERVHAQRFHSFDVVLTNVLGILFWFNPVVKIYKKTLIHLHEYEADARTVKYHNVNEYCSLLAKVALLSADIRLANHFGNSLTLKRIEMMRKIRSKTKWWKIALIICALPLFFFAVSCQDQLVNADKSNDGITTLDSPAPILILERFEALKKAKPNSTIILVEFNEEGTRLMERMEKAHGVPASIELFTPDNERHKNSVLNTEPEKITFNQSNVWEATAAGTRTFAIIEYNERKDSNADDSGVYTIVDETAVPENGLGVFMEAISQKIMYPSQARRMGVEGKVFVEFIVHEDGSISDIKAIKGIGAGCDNAAVLAVKGSMVKWKPGKVNGLAVKQRMVMPVSFKLANTPPLKDEAKAPENVMEEMVVIGQKTK